MKKTYPLLLSVLAIVALLPAAASGQGGGDKKQKDVEVKCPSGIDHSAWDGLLKKHVDGKGLVNYAAWKGSKSDMDALDGYLK